jgi:hypothetical protein
VEVGRGEEFAQQGLVHGIHAPGDPEGFEFRVDIGLRSGPFFHGGEHGGDREIADLAAAAVTRATLGLFQVVE